MMQAANSLSMIFAPNDNKGIEINQAEGGK